MILCQATCIHLLLKKKSKRKTKAKPKPYTALLGLYIDFWFTPLRNMYTIKPRFCFHIAEFVMCRQPHQKSGCKQPRSSPCTAPLQKVPRASRRGLRAGGTAGKGHPWLPWLLLLPPHR